MSDETEKDANLSLIELDKGLKSGNKGDQVECVISFADVFNKHPFPIFINSVCLKLSDCFNVSNNFVRLCIVRVVQESRRHLDKIQNVDEFLARIFQVVHSNDPVARAVTIRFLAACAPILKERKNVHHAVLEALNSNDEVEVQAAIHAATEFSKVSQTFNKGAIDAIASKIQTAAVTMKLQLIPTLQYMDASQEMTQKARLICEDLLDNYIAHDMVVTILSTLTNLCCRSLSDISQQLELLFTWLNNDCRQPIQLSVLHNLQLLLKTSPHHLTSSHVQRLLQYERSTSDVKCRSVVLQILAVTVNSLTVHCFMDMPAQDTMDDGNVSILQTLLNSFGFDVDLEISSLCMRLCTKLLLHLPEEQFTTHCDDVIVGIQSLTMSSVAQSSLDSLKESLVCMKRLAKKVDNNQFIDVLLTLLKSTTHDDCRLLICEALMTLELPPNVVFHDLLGVLVDCQNGSSKLVVMLCSVILHTSMCYVEMGKSTLSTISNVLSTQDYWSMYRVSRQALRFGQYELAVTLLDQLRCQVSSEASLYFISCLNSFAKSQIHLQQARGDDSTCVDHALLDKAMMSLTETIRSVETIGKGNNFSFHSNYLNLLYTDLCNNRRLQCVCNMYWLCPPPALGKMEGARTGDDLIRYGRLTEELRKCAADTHKLHTQYSSLQQSLIDADKETHRHVKVLMERTFFLCQLLDTVLSGERQFTVSALSAADDDIIESIKRDWPRSTSISESAEISITPEQMQSLKLASIRLMMEDRLPLPRYFFQRLQTTSATINVTPHQKAGESVLLHVHSYLTLTVEGIINYSNPTGLKHVRKVEVSVTSRKQQHSNDSTSATDKSPVDSDVALNSTVTLVNDYFTTEFLLSFPNPGQHAVNIICQVLDGNDIKWDIDCTSEIHVKSFREKKHSTYMKST